MNTALQRIYTAASECEIGVMLDLDGATSPNGVPGIHTPVEPDLEYQEWIQTLAENNCPVVINTGRPSIFVHNLFPSLHTMPKENVFVATETGASVVAANGEVLSKKAVHNIDALRDLFTAEVKRFPGAIVEEHKACSITISLKNCVTDQVRKDGYDHMLAFGDMQLEHGFSYHIIPVWKGALDTYIEFVPVDVNKGNAARHVMDRFPTTTWVAYGDSKADESMMYVTRDRGGLSVGIGKSIQPELIDISLDTIAQARHILKTTTDLVAKRTSLTDAMALGIAPNARFG